MSGGEITPSQGVLLAAVGMRFDGQQLFMRVLCQATAVRPARQEEIAQKTLGNAQAGLGGGLAPAMIPDSAGE